MLEKIKDKLKIFLNKVENEPWYIKIFIGSWVSLYTSVIIWFLLTSWNTVLYEGESLKLLLISIASCLGFIWVAIVVMFNIYIKKTTFKKVLTGIHFVLVIFLIKPILVLILLIPTLLTMSRPPNYISYHPMVMSYELSSLRIPPISFREAYNKKDKEYSYHTGLYGKDSIYSRYRFIYHYNIFDYIGEEFFKTYASYIYGGGGYITRLEKAQMGDLKPYTTLYNNDVWESRYQNIYKVEYFDNLESIINNYKEKINNYEDSNIVCKLKNKYSYKNMIDETEHKKYCTRLLSFYIPMHYSLIYYTDLLTGNYMKNITVEELKVRQKFALGTLEYLQKNMPKDLQKLTDLNKLKKIIEG